MFIVAGATALSPFKQRQLLARISALTSTVNSNGAGNSVTALDSQYVYLFDQDLSEHQQKAALQLLNDGQHYALTQPQAGDIQVLVTTRLGTISPWSSKATDIFKNCNVYGFKLKVFF